MERHVLKNEKWATLVATTRSTRPYSFQEYCAALQTYLCTIIDKGDFVDPPIAPAPALHVLHGEQYSAARQTASLNRPGTKSRKGNCRRCGKPGHWQAECRQKALQTHLDALHARVKEAGGSTGGTARVLFEIGEELDQITGDTQPQDLSNSSSTEETERKESNAIFESFFAADIPPQEF
jgi:Zinc knuckle